jgi:hypothetical protein
VLVIDVRGNKASRKKGPWWWQDEDEDEDDDGDGDGDGDGRWEQGASFHRFTGCWPYM